MTPPTGPVSTHPVADSGGQEWCRPREQRIETMHGIVQVARFSVALGVVVVLGVVTRRYKDTSGAGNSWWDGHYWDGLGDATIA